jgi:hypothetical protein
MECEKQHQNLRFCIGCNEWLPFSMFNRTGRSGKFQTVRCKPCRNAHDHGMTVREICERQGVSSPRCAVCGSTENLEVDHDHKHCNANKGCRICVRGYLCHDCNSSEGLLKTSDHAFALALYMLNNSIAYAAKFSDISENIVS